MTPNPDLLAEILTSNAAYLDECDKPYSASLQREAAETIRRMLAERREKETANG